MGKTSDHTNIVHMLATRWERFIAATIDFFIMTFPFFAIAIPEEDPSSKFVIICLAIFLIVIIYQLTILSRYGQTLGKRIMKIQIVGVQTEKNEGFLTNVLVRSFANSIIGYLVKIYPTIDYLFIFRKNRRCLHDLIARTKVVSLKAKPFTIKARYLFTSIGIILFLYICVAISFSYLTSRAITYKGFNYFTQQRDFPNTDAIKEVKDFSPYFGITVNYPEVFSINKTIPRLRWSIEINKLKVRPEDYKLFIDCIELTGDGKILKLKPLEYKPDIFFDYFRDFYGRKVKRNYKDLYAYIRSDSGKISMPAYYELKSGTNKFDLGWEADSLPKDIILNYRIKINKSGDEKIFEGSFHRTLQEKNFLIRKSDIFKGKMARLFSWIRFGPSTVWREIEYGIMRLSHRITSSIKRGT